MNSIALWQEAGPSQSLALIVNLSAMVVLGLISSTTLLFKNVTP